MVELPPDLGNKRRLANKTGILADMKARWLCGLLAMMMAITAAPVSAQFYFKNPDLSGPPVVGNEPGLTVPLPGATPTELRAGLVWSLRAALNVAALRCQFEPTLLSVHKYNAVLLDHQTELKDSLDTLGKYFSRMANSKTKAKVKATSSRSGVGALDQYGTRLYSMFSNVGSQYLFCQTAADIGYGAITAPRGQFYMVAETRMRELRNGMQLLGEQAFGGRRSLDMSRTRFPRFDPQCWTKQNYYDARACGPF